MHPEIGRCNLCSGDKLPQAESRWRDPRAALTFTIHGAATWAPAGCAAASLSSLGRGSPRLPRGHDLGSPLSPAPPLGLPAPARNLGRSRAMASAAGQGPPGGARRRARARKRPTMPGPRANGRPGPPPAGRDLRPDCLTRRFRFVFPTAGVPGRRDALRTAGSQGP